MSAKISAVPTLAHLLQLPSQRPVDSPIQPKYTKSRSFVVEMSGRWGTNCSPRLGAGNELQPVVYLNSSLSLSMGVEFRFEGPGLNLSSIFQAIIQQDERSSTSQEHFAFSCITTPKHFQICKLKGSKTLQALALEHHQEPFREDFHGKVVRCCT